MNHASFEIIDGFGFKTFTDKDVCDFAYNAQLQAYELGYATKIIERLNDFQICMEPAETKWIMDNLEAGKYYEKVFVKMAVALEPILYGRPYKKKRTRRNLLDFTRHNLGIYRNGIVMLDFS